MDSLAPRAPVGAAVARPASVARPGIVGRAALALTLALGLLLGLLVGAVAPASAHDQLLSSSPADGAVLDHLPALVELTFNGAVADLGSALVVEAASGAVVQNAPPTIDGALVRSPLPPDLSGGGYVVRWRVVAQDGHPIEGIVRFTVAGPTAETTDPPTAAPTDSPTDTPATPEPSPTLADGAGPEEGGSRLAPVLGGLLALGAVAAGAVAFVRRRAA